MLLGLLSDALFKQYVYDISLEAHMIKNLPTLWETQVQSLGREHPLGKEVHGNPLQYSCLENSMDKGAWQSAVHGVTRVRHS